MSECVRAYERQDRGARIYIYIYIYTYMHAYTQYTKHDLTPHLQTRSTDRVGNCSNSSHAYMYTQATYTQITLCYICRQARHTELKFIQTLAYMYTQATYTQIKLCDTCRQARRTELKIIEASSKKFLEDRDKDDCMYVCIHTYMHAYTQHMT